MTEREAFEEYFKRELWDKCMGSAHGPNFMFADGNGDYYHGAMNIAWDAWKKRAELVVEVVHDAQDDAYRTDSPEEDTFLRWVSRPLLIIGPLVGTSLDVICLSAHLLINEPRWCWRWQRVARWRLRRLLRDVMRGDT